MSASRNFGYLPYTNTMKSASSISSFPLWQYLKQPIGERDRKPILNPKKFWRMKKVSYIERCWVTSYQPEERAY